jgi:hypothetical protein
MKKCKFYRKCTQVKIVKLLLGNKVITDYMRLKCFNSLSYECSYKIALTNNKGLK